MSYDAERAKRRTIANAPAWVKELLESVRAERPHASDEQLIDAFGILEVLGLERTAEEWST